MMTRRVSAKLVGAAAVAVCAFASSAMADIPFFQGYETDDSGWIVLGGSSEVTRVASGTNGVTSASGGFHAIAKVGDPGSYGYGLGTGSYTQWNGYSSTFPGTYYLRTDFYLDSAITEGTTWQEELWWNVGISDIFGSYAGESSVRPAKKDATSDWSINIFPIGGGGGSVSGIASDQWIQVFNVVRASENGFARNDIVIKDANGNFLAEFTGDTSVLNADLGGNRFGWFAIWDDYNNQDGSGSTIAPGPVGGDLGIPVDNLRSVALLAGDANLDDVVNGLDLSIVASNWMTSGHTGGWRVGDFNEDGTVNGLDLSGMAANWLGDQSVSGGGVSFDEALASVGLGGIPEPASLMLLAVGGVALMGRRRSA